MCHTEFLGSARAVKLTANKWLNHYIRARASVYRTQGWRYTQPWFLRPDAQSTGLVFGMGVNLALVFVVLPMGINAVVDYKVADVEHNEYSLAHAKVTDEMVLTLLNRRRAAAGLPPATHLLTEGSEHEEHVDHGAAALAQFDSVWSQVEECLTKHQPEAAAAR